MFHLWFMGPDQQWQYLGALQQSALERNLLKGHTNDQFFAMAA